MSQKPDGDGFNHASRELGRAIKLWGRALPITRGAAFYITLVALLTVFVYVKDSNTSASLHVTQRGICTVIHGADASQRRTVSRLDAAIRRDSAGIRADRQIEGVWRFAVRQNRHNPQGRRLGEKLVRGWQTIISESVAARAELQQERDEASTGGVTFPGC